MVDTKEGTKFTEEEMKKISDFKDKYDTLTISYGQIAMDKLIVEESENKLKYEYSKTREEEKVFVKELSDKYGIGSLNMETGVFIPE
jgi:hypothetical protein